MFYFTDGFYIEIFCSGLFFYIVFLHLCFKEMSGYPPFYIEYRINKGEKFTSIQFYLVITFGISLLSLAVMTARSDPFFDLLDTQIWEAAIWLAVSYCASRIKRRA